MTWIWFAVGAVSAIAVLVVVHEFGHFLVAKLFGVGVPVFSVGMGPRVFGIRWKGTDYRLSAVPVGGYVRMSGADPFGEEDFSGDGYVPPEKDFMKKPVWQRLLIMLAGPAANLVLPVVLFAGLYLWGVPDTLTVVGQVSHDSAADQVGLQVDDRILAVEGEPVEASGRLNDLLVERVGTPVDLTIARGEQELSITLPPGAYELETPSRIKLSSLGASLRPASTRFGIDDPDSPAARAGLQSLDGVLAVDGAPVETWTELQDALTPGASHTVRYVRGDEETGERTEGEVTLEPDPSWSPRLDDPLSNAFGMVPAQVFVGTIMKGLPGDQAGLKPGDRVYAIDGTPVHDFSELVRLVNTSLDTSGPEPTSSPLTVELVRDGERLAHTLTPIVDDEPSVYGTTYRVLIGFSPPPQTEVSGEPITVRYGPIEATGKGVERTYQAVVDTFTALSSLARGLGNPADAVGGPVAIFTVTGRSLMAGFHYFAGTIAVISVSLAIVNLLPVPALDGGQIAVFLFEWIRGRPLSAEVRMRIQMVGVILLFTLLILVTANDIGRLIFPGL